MKLGARTVKTGIGVLLSILIGNLIPYISTMQPTWIAILGLQQTVPKSWHTLLSRTIAAFTGGLTAVVAYLSFGNSAVVTGATIIVFIMIMNAMRLQSVIGLASITTIIIMLSPYASTTELIQKAFWRVMENIIGVLIAFFVNLLILPPHYDARFYEAVHTTSSEVLIRLRAILRKNGEYRSLNADLAAMQDAIAEMDRLFELAKDEIVWRPSKRLARQRKLVVFRSFLSVLKEMGHLLYLIHTHTDTLFELDDDLRFEMRERIETLSAANEQIYLKFDGRISPKQVNFFAPTRDRRQQLMQHLFNEARIEGKPDSNKLKKSNALVLIAGAIVNVEDELIHLNDLVRSYHTYHHEAAEAQTN